MQTSFKKKCCFFFFTKLIKLSLSFQKRFHEGQGSRAATMCDVRVLMVQYGGCDKGQLPAI